MPDMPDDLLKSTAGAVRTLGRVFKKRVRTSPTLRVPTQYTWEVRMMPFHPWFATFCPFRRLLDGPCPNRKCRQLDQWNISFCDWLKQCVYAWCSQLTEESVVLLQVQQAFGANTWPLPSDRELSVHGPVTFKNRDVSECPQHNNILCSCFIIFNTWRCAVPRVARSTTLLQNLQYVESACDE